MRTPLEDGSQQPGRQPLPEHAHAGALDFSASRILISDVYKLPSL